MKMKDIASYAAHDDFAGFAVSSRNDILLATYKNGETWWVDVVGVIQGIADIGLPEWEPGNPGAPWPSEEL